MSIEVLHAELKQMQGDIQRLDAQRDRLSLKTSIEEHKISEATAKMTELGIKDADKLTGDQLAALRDETQVPLSLCAAQRHRAA